MVKEAVYVDGFGSDLEFVEEGIEWLRRVAAEDVSSTVNIVMPTMSSYVRGSIEDLYGDDIARALSQGKSVSLANGVMLAPTAITTMRLRFQSPVLAVYCKPKDLSQVDTLAVSQRMCIVAINEAEANAWIKKHSAQPSHGGSVATAQQSGQINPVVEEAFKSITLMVNLDSGVAHPRDHDKVVHAFRILKRNSEEIDFEALSGWLVAHNWKSGYADQVVGFGKRVYGGRSPKAGTNPWGPQAIKTWRKKANEEK